MNKDPPELTNSELNDNNIYITLTNSNSLNGKTIQLEKLLMRFNNKMSINVFTETCLQVPLHDHFLGMKWAHALTDINDRNAGVSICYHPALGQHTVLKTSEILRNRLIALKFTPPGKGAFVEWAFTSRHLIVILTRVFFLRLVLVK